MQKSRVAVVGLGPAGIVTLKNLLEEGFDAIGIEKNAYVGGLWKFSEDALISVLPSTTVNISKQRGCFTDFPFGEDVDTYPNAKDVQNYLLCYVSHFKLESHIRLNTAVVSVDRDEDETKWRITSRNDTGTESTELFDKLVIANGTGAIPNVPVIQNQHSFKGEVLHAAAFKRPQAFQSRNVLIVGLGNTAADTATVLRGVANKVYLSYNTGAIIMPRILPNGSALDHGLSYRKMGILYTLEHYVPSLADSVALRFANAIQTRSFNIQSKWRLSPAPPLIHRIPIISDTFVDGLASGEILPVAGLRTVVDATTVQLDDSTTLEVDTIIFATGYNLDYSMLGKHEPTDPSVSLRPLSHNTNNRDTSAPLPLREPRARRIPLLYRNIFSLSQPHSLAFVGAAAFPSPAFQIFDLASMAIAQLWSSRAGTAQLPPRLQMLESVDDHVAWVHQVSSRGSFNPRWVRAPEWMAWADVVLGLGLAENLSFFSPEAWRLWYWDPGFYRLLMDGIYSPHIYRLFDSHGKRKAWDGAGEAIRKVNRSVSSPSDENGAEREQTNA